MSMAQKESGKMFKEKKIDHKEQNNTTLVSLNFVVVLIFESTSDGKADTTKV